MVLENITFRPATRFFEAALRCLWLDSTIFALFWVNKCLLCDKIDLVRYFLQLCDQPRRKEVSHFWRVIRWFLLGMRVDQLKVLILVVKHHIFRLPVWILEFCQTYFRLGKFSLWFWPFINFAAGRFRVDDNFFFIVLVGDCRFTWQDFFFHRVIKSTFPDVNCLFRTSTDKVVSFSTELRVIRVSLKSVLKFAFLWVPNFGRSVIRWRDQVRTVRMEIDWFNWTLVTLVNLNHMLGSQIVKFDFLVMGTWSHAIP